MINKKAIKKVLHFIITIILSALCTCVIFFVLLALWGLVAAPFVRLKTASPIVAIALLLAMAITVLLFSIFEQRRKRKVINN